ncbi:MAG: hypothetical protein IAF58_00980 [Leptolyngbya sp.]|nr:hypothetical protein [Candidatus Melainabacteria bacterium]
MLNHAQSLILCGRQLIAEIPKFKNDAARENYIQRLLTVARLLSANVGAQLVAAYISYWETSPGFPRYDVLAKQARSFADSALRENWDVSAPLALLLPEEALSLCASSSIENVVRCGNAAFATAMCLHAHMELLPTKDRFVHQAAVPYPFLNKKKIAPFVYPRVKEVFVKNFVTQERIIALHREDVIDDAKERRCLLLDTHVNITPAYSFLAGGRTKQ